MEVIHLNHLIEVLVKMIQILLEKHHLKENQMNLIQTIDMFLILPVQKLHKLK